MDLERTVFLLLVFVTVALALRAALSPAPAATATERVLLDIQRDVARIRQLSESQPRNWEEAVDTLARIHDLAHHVDALLTKLAELQQAQPPGPGQH